MTGHKHHRGKGGHYHQGAGLGSVHVGASGISFMKANDRIEKKTIGRSIPNKVRGQ